MLALKGKEVEIYIYIGERKKIVYYLNREVSIEADIAKCVFVKLTKVRFLSPNWLKLHWE